MDTVSHPEHLETERPVGTGAVYAHALRTIRDALRALPPHEQVRALASAMATVSHTVGRHDVRPAPHAPSLPASVRATLSARQAQVVDVIEQVLALKGRPPTLREIGSAMGIRSTNGVNDHLKALRRKGIIDYEPFTARSLRILPPESFEAE